MDDVLYIVYETLLRGDYPRSCSSLSLNPLHLRVFTISLEKQDRTIFNKVSKFWQHPLLSLMPHAKEMGYNLRKKRSHRLEVRTERFKNMFINRLVFNYDLVID